MERQGSMGIVISFAIVCLHPFGKIPSGENLDGKTTRCLHVESPAMKSFRRLHIESVVLQTLVDLVDSLFALLYKTNMEGGGVLDFGCPPDLYQGEHPSIVVEQRGKLVVVPPSMRCNPKYVSRNLTASDTSVTVRLRWFS